MTSPQISYQKGSRVSLSPLFCLRRTNCNAQSTVSALAVSLLCQKRQQGTLMETQIHLRKYILDSNAILKVPLGFQ